MELHLERGRQLGRQAESDTPLTCMNEWPPGGHRSGYRVYTEIRNYDRIMAMEPMIDVHFKCPASILKDARDRSVNVSAAAREGVVARTYGGVLVTASWYSDMRDKFGGDPDARALGAAPLVMTWANGHDPAPGDGQLPEADSPQREGETGGGSLGEWFKWVAAVACAALALSLISLYLVTTRSTATA